MHADIVFWTLARSSQRTRVTLPRRVRAALITLLIASSAGARDQDALVNTSGMQPIPSVDSLLMNTQLGCMERFMHRIGTLQKNVSTLTAGMANLQKAQELVQQVNSMGWSNVLSETGRIIGNRESQPATRVSTAATLAEELLGLLVTESTSNFMKLQGLLSEAQRQMLNKECTAASPDDEVSRILQQLGYSLGMTSSSAQEESRASSVGSAGELAHDQIASDVSSVGSAGELADEESRPRALSIGSAGQLANSRNRSRVSSIGSAGDLGGRANLSSVSSIVSAGANWNAKSAGASNEDSEHEQAARSNEVARVANEEERGKHVAEHKKALRADDKEYHREQDVQEAQHKKKSRSDNEEYEHLQAARSNKVVVRVNFRFENLDYDKVVSSPKAVESLKSQVGEGIARIAEVSPSRVEVELSAGSVVVDARLGDLTEAQAKNLNRKLEVEFAEFLQHLEKSLIQLPQISAALVDPKAGLGAIAPKVGDVCDLVVCPNLTEFTNSNAGAYESMDEWKERSLHRRRGQAWRHMGRRVRRDGSKSWEMTDMDKIWLQVGWLVQLCGFVALAFLLTFLWSLAPVAGDEGTHVPMWFAGMIQFYLCGGGLPGKIFSALVIIICFLNYMLFAMATEAAYKKGGTVFGWEVQPWIFWVHDYVKLGSIGFFAIVTLLRLGVIHTHPLWKQYGSGAWIRYLFCDAFMFFDLCAMGLSLIDYRDYISGEEINRSSLIEVTSVTNKYTNGIIDKTLLRSHREGEIIINFVWLALARVAEVLVPTGALTGMSKIYTTISQQRWFVFTVFIVGLIVWMILAGFYFVANRENEFATWEAARFNGEPWQRFESLPSSMFFVLLNLCREHPLSSAHVRPLSRWIVILTTITGVPIFAVPASIISTILMQSGYDEEEEEIGEEEYYYDHEGGEEEKIVERSVTTEDQATVPSAPNQGEDQADGEEDPRMAPAEIAVERKDSWQAKYDPSRLPLLRIALTNIVCFGSVWLYFASTARRMRLFGLSVYVSPFQFAEFDGLLGFCFFVEFAYRAYTLKSQYLLSIFGVIDFFASVPGVVHMLIVVIVGQGGTAESKKAETEEDFAAGCGWKAMWCDVIQSDYIHWLGAAGVLRIFKTERHLHVFRDMKEIFIAYRPMLMATGFVALFCVLLFSTLLYISEFENPDKEMQENFGSVPRSLWAEILNLHGEWVWCDFTSAGKCICTIIACFAISLCIIPLAIFSSGFYFKVHETANWSAETMFVPWQKAWRPEGFLRNIYDLLYFHHHKEAAEKSPRTWRFYRSAISGLVLMNVMISIFLTLQAVQPETCHQSDFCRIVDDMFYWTDFVSLGFFSIDFVLRTIALKGLHPFSSIGLCDLASLLGIFISLQADIRANHRRPKVATVFCRYDFMIPMRLLRLFTLESYVGSCRILLSVVYNSMEPLFRLAFTIASLWLVYATLLYSFEKNHWVYQDDSDDKAQANRYEDIFYALPYALIHLTGDFPLTVYTWQAKIVHCIFTVLGMCSIAALTGVFSSAFVSCVANDRMKEISKAAQMRMTAVTKVVIVIQRRFRQSRKAKAEALASVDPESDTVAAKTSNEAPPPEAQRSKFSELQLEAKRFVDRQTTAGKITMTFFNVVLVLNVITNTIWTMPEISQYIHKIPYTDAISRLVVNAVFLVEFVLRIFAEGWGKSSFAFIKAFSFPRMLDFICLMPGILDVIHETDALDLDTMLSGGISELDSDEFIWGVTMLRLVRIADFPCFRREVVMVSRVFGTVSSQLLVPAFVVLNFWVFSACAFAWTETYFNGPTQRDFDSIPSAMYWTLIFLVGDWVIIDFTPTGAGRLVVLFCIWGIMIFAVPFGMIMEAMQSTLMMVAQEEAPVSQLDQVHAENMRKLRSPSFSRWSRRGSQDGVEGAADDNGTRRSRKVRLNFVPDVTEVSSVSGVSATTLGDNESW